jgi:uncharacterized damage-inducible protein DinB
MVEYLKTVLTNQFEAALCMLDQCVKVCKPEHWEGKIANGTFRQVAYHTLFFVDLYLSKNADAFELRELHHRGGDERNPTLSAGLSQEETLEYIKICRNKAIDSLAAETRESLEGHSGFRQFSRGELHVYNIRHIQHHSGQLSAYLRRVDLTLSDHKSLSWVGTGWR